MPDSDRNRSRLVTTTPLPPPWPTHTMYLFFIIVWNFFLHNCLISNVWPHVWQKTSILDWSQGSACNRVSTNNLSLLTTFLFLATFYKCLLSFRSGSMCPIMIILITPLKAKSLITFRIQVSLDVVVKKALYMIKRMKSLLVINYAGLHCWRFSKLSRL